MRSFKVIIICLLTLHLGNIEQLHAQPETDTDVVGTPAWVVKFSPLALLELPHPSLQVAVEYRVAPKLALQHELGWMPPLAGGGLFNNGLPSYGYKGKSELRYYFEEVSHPGFKKQRQYLAFEIMYRSRILKQESWYRLNGGSFSQWLETEQYRNQMAFHFKYGKQINLSSSKGIFIDSYAGLGLRRYFARQNMLTSELQGEPDNLRDSYDFLLPSLTLGFKVGFGR